MADYLSNNPAGRLYQILSEVTKQRNDHESMQTVWARIFGLEESNAEEIFRAYVELLRLLKTAREAVEQLPDIDPNLYVKPFERLERAFTVSSITTNLGSFKRHLTEGTMTALQFCAHALGKVSDEPEVSQATLRKLREQVEALISEVLSTELQYEIRVFLVERLEEIRRAIIYYRINGTRGLRKALETTIGASYLLVHSGRSIEFEDEKKRESWKRIGKAFANVVMEIAKIVAPEVAKALIDSNLPILPSQ